MASLQTRVKKPKPGAGAAGEHRLAREPTGMAARPHGVPSVAPSTNSHRALWSGQAGNRKPCTDAFKIILATQANTSDTAITPVLALRCGAGDGVNQQALLVRSRRSARGPLMAATQVARRPARRRKRSKPPRTSKPGDYLDTRQHADKTPRLRDRPRFKGKNIECLQLHDGVVAHPCSTRLCASHLLITLPPVH